MRGLESTPCWIAANRAREHETTDAAYGARKEKDFCGERKIQRAIAIASLGAA